MTQVMRRAIRVNVSGNLTAFAGFDDLPNCLFERDGNVPARVVLLHLSQIGVVANVVPDAVVIHVGVDLSLAGEFLGPLEGF